MELKKSFVHNPNQKSGVYHSNTDCHVYKRANKKLFALGIGKGKSHCSICAKLDKPGAKFDPEGKRNLYAISKFLDGDVQKEIGLQIKFDVYLQDPLVATMDPRFAFDNEFFVNWESGIADGPTSARFAVVDFNSDTGTLSEPAKWNSDELKFFKGKELINQNCAKDPNHFQFHQVNLWCILQRTLAEFEDKSCLGRHISWGFNSNRLIVVPHAGYGKNAFYDRESKSLQFYYFDAQGGRVYTCLSADIINHEFGHALLDGIRPHFYDSTLVETAAFHEFMGDLTAILMVMRNNTFRNALADRKERDLRSANPLNSIAEQFGKMIGDNDYLRSATNKLTMAKLPMDAGPHLMSEVLTGTMFDILDRLSKSYYRVREKKWLAALNYTLKKMQQIAIQALDFLPPVDATFRDYMMAVLVSFDLSNRLDKYEYYEMILKAFKKSGILSEREFAKFSQKENLYKLPTLRVRYSVDDIARSRATAYRFLDDNRSVFNIPVYQDFEILDLYTNHKCTIDRRMLPEQTILQYGWKEDIVLKGRGLDFDAFNGEHTAISCGGTIVFDEDNMVYWTDKPGIYSSDAGSDERGKIRRDEILRNIAHRIQGGHVGGIIGSSKGILGTRVPLMTADKKDGRVTFQLSPHLNLDGDVNENFKANRKWEVSS